jgi:homoserine dehydrogenase
MSLLDFDHPPVQPQRPPSPAVARPRLQPALAGLDVVVLKFGSSVLRGPEDVPDVVSEIYRHVRRGRRVVAVVSAMHGHTDQLLDQARRLGAGHDNGHLPRYVALGEEKAASLVAIGCDRVGLDCVALGVRELAIQAEGSPEDAAPVCLGSDALQEAVARHEVVLVPGFGALNDHGRVVLLGRGGSDLTAVFVAAELGLGRVRLIKDVDGVYDADPASGASQRYAALDWDTAREVAGKLVQARAIEVAEARGVEIEVAALGRGEASLIGPEGLPSAPAPEQRRLRVAVAGCGVVGGGVLQRLWAHPETWEVVAVLVRDPAKTRDVDVPRRLLTDDPDQLFDQAPDVLIEALSEGPAGERLIRRALEAGVHVVSANKQALALDLEGLNALAAARGCALAYSAAVGGGSPILETVRAARAAGPVSGFEAVLNGTVNFILDQLGHGAGFDEALGKARAAGFAEEDPSSDLEGHDAAAKLRILAWEAFGTMLSDQDTPRSPLHPSAACASQAWAAMKQIGRCRREAEGYRASVALEIAVQDPLFRSLRGEGNAVKVVLADGRVFACRGRGAGRWPTTESVFADLGDVTRSAQRI